MQACTPAAGVVSNLSLEGLENYAKMNGKITQSCILKRCFFLSIEYNGKNKWSVITYSTQQNKQAQH